MLKLLVVLLLASTVVKAESTKTAGELIKQAHGHDNMYTLGEQASQQKALGFYQSALTAKPDKKQRLHILYRMAQLYGSSYDLTKGEKPDFHKAIELNKKIVAEYPRQEPLVYKAMSSICDHYTTVRDFESAIRWSKKTLGFKPSEMAEQLESGEIDKESADKIRRYQRRAVGQIAYSADHISYLRSHGELRRISDEYYGTFIAERAGELLSENMDKMPDLWAPTNDEPLSSSGSTLQAVDSVPAAHNERQKNLQVQSNGVPEITEARGSAEPNVTEISQKEEYVAKEPRAPPLIYFKKYIIVAAAMAVLALAAIIIRKRKTSFKELD